MRLYRDGGQIYKPPQEVHKREGLQIEYNNRLRAERTMQYRLVGFITRGLKWDPLPTGMFDLFLYTR